MKIILLQDILHLGRKYDVKDAADGYGRNFLIPRNLAKPATEAALRELTILKAREERGRSEEYQKYKAMAEKLRPIVLQFKLKVGERGKKTGGLFAGSLPTEASKASVMQKRSQGVSEGGNRAFGSVTAVKIRDALQKQGIPVEKDWVLLEEPIKTTGEREVEIKFPQEINGKVKVVVEAE